MSGPVPLPTEKNVYCVIRSPVQGQGLARALRDPHAQAADRHPPADARRRSTRSSGSTTCPPASTSRSGSRCDDGGDPRQEARHDPGLHRGRRASCRVTVIEAGPCPVTAVRDAERDGYDAVQLAFGEVAREAADQGRARPPEEGRRAAAAPPGRVPRRGRRARGRRRGDGRRRLRAGPDASRSPASRRARASRARSSATTSAAARSATAPTTSARPGSIGASADPARVFKGMRMPGPDGQQARHPARPRGRRRRRRAQPAAGARLGPGPEGRASWRCAAMAEAAPRRHELGKPGEASTCPTSVFAEPFHESLVHEAARAELAARRRGTASTLTRGEVAMTARSLAPEGHRPRPRRLARASRTATGGGVAFGPKPRHYTVKVNRKARRAGAARGAVASTPSAAAIAVLDAGALRRARRPSRPPRRSTKWGGGGRVLVVLGRRGGARARSPSATSRA